MKNRLKNNSFILLLGLAMYSITLMVSMAFMNVGFCFFLLCFILYFGSGKEMRNAITSIISEPHAKLLLKWSGILSLACWISLLYAKINPLNILGHAVEVNLFRDIFKTWYLFTPFILAAALRAL